jgi:hypothetical protein
MRKDETQRYIKKSALSRMRAHDVWAINWHLMALVKYRRRLHNENPPAHSNQKDPTLNVDIS